ncbi:hypothetical protein [Cyclobacterium xiamenense]|uniref:hypothetical protein n=1 Tax=Cyclobacterium xiamenense TaxID=1297121 RepID=UPI0035CE9E18
MQLIVQSRNPVYRNLEQTAYREGLQAARDLYQRGRKLHFSETQAQASGYSPYLEGIGKMVSYGISGSMVAAAALPALGRGMVEGPNGRVVQRMGFEAGLQIGMSLLFNGDLKSTDIADIGFAGLFSRFAFVGQSFVDFKYTDGLKTSIGLGMDKTIWDTSLGFGFGGINSGYKKLLDSSEIDKNVITIISTFNGGMRTLVTEAATPVD